MFAKKVFLIALGLAVVLNGLGCSAKGPLFTKVMGEPEKTTIYIYRPSRFLMSGQKARTFVDGRRFVDLANGGYSYVSLSPGKHKIEVKGHLMFNIPNQAVELDPEPGTEYYIRFVPELEDIEFLGSMDIYYMQQGSLMGLVAPETALPEIEKCRLIEPEWK